MTKVSLRLYNREIENLIDHGQIEEAISHSKYILQSYPKHIETYRLLGKALLECQQYGEASDVFQRVLSSIPDDFVSQVAMSIICEDEGNLDESIWHMERAYEVQPSNAAIQDELRRLLGRRDGSEPSKIRMTRGALARMYAKGDLYQQAIAELHAILAEEPGRADLQVLLAQMCFKSGKQIEATELCSTLLSKFPYCFEANVILSKILPNTTRSEDAKIYNQRIFALDPYAAFQNQDHPTANDVLENSVMLDRLDYRPGSKESTSQPEWAASLGLTLPGTPTAEDSEPLPDWLTEFDKPTPVLETKKVSMPEDDAQSLTPEQGDNEKSIPDWMKSAGWLESTVQKDEAVTQSEIANEEPLTEATPADLPDWLKEMAPPAPSQEIPAEQSAGEELPDWINQLGDETPRQEERIDNTAREIPDWLKDIQLLPDENLGEANSQQPGSIAKQFEPEQNAEIPDWLQELKTQPTVSTPPEVEVEIPVIDARPTPEAPVTLPVWLEGLDYVAEIPPEPHPAADFPVPSPVFTSILSPEETEQVPGLSTTETDQDAAFAWLESLAAKQGADEETLFVKPEQRTETPPDWIKQAVAESAPSEELPQEYPSQPAQEIPLQEETPSGESFGLSQKSGMTMPLSTDDDDWLKSLSTPPSMLAQPPVEETIPVQQPSFSSSPDYAPNAEDTDAALAWLENLAAKHGAEEETLYVKPEDRIENPPEWVQHTTQVEPEPLISSPGIPEDQLASLVPGEEGSIETSEKQEDELPGWLKGFDETQPASSEEIATELTPSWFQEAPEPIEEIITPAAPVVSYAKSESEPPAAQPSSETLMSEVLAQEPAEYANVLRESQSAMSDGKVGLAVDGYSQLVKNGAFLDDIIHDLRDALYRFPVDISIWQILGEAYLRSNRLQDALDSFAKAEDLIR